MDGVADVAETSYTELQSEPDAAPVRPIVRRVKPAPGSQLCSLRHLQLSRLDHRLGKVPDTVRNWQGPDHGQPSRDRECHTRHQTNGVSAEPAGFYEMAAWLPTDPMAGGKCLMADNLARWTARGGVLW